MSLIRKSTYTSILGLEQARSEAAALYQQSMQAWISLLTKPIACAALPTLLSNVITDLKISEPALIWCKICSQHLSSHEKKHAKNIQRHPSHAPDTPLLDSVSAPLICVT